MKTALNQMTVRRLGYTAFLDLAQALGCVGVEVRNDLGRPLFDGLDAAEAGAMARDRGLRLLGLSEVYAFNSWSDEIRTKVEALLSAAKASGAETISLIPRNDGTQTGNGERQANLRIALKQILPMLQAADMVALVEPLGFARSSLRSKAELVDVIEDLGAGDHYKLVHDTFHHRLAEEDAMFAKQTGILHVSGVVDAAPSVAQMEDEHRVLVNADDRLGNIEQIKALRAAGYEGAISFECFAPEVHAMSEPYAALKRSFDFIASALQPNAG
ncbi:TIM barrel protein [Phaeobacter sp. HF9A]|uniref:TIM barrel protein n=1 Tax=Phaeobacter sp. HF9A TaxID=2721561 RepID=UPI00142F6917|nr:TIM barrel protein [Phaeobacter sp. HF9A]NIZ12568.1 TIM barrel protein [Phaeobacter sp. HF9A]